MHAGKVKANDLVRRGNNFLFIGTIWGFFVTFICPCPICVMGTLSFLSAGVMSKLGLGRKLKKKIGTMECEHEHAHNKKSEPTILPGVSPVAATALYAGPPIAKAVRS